MRKILLVSADRAERGLLQPIMVELNKRKDVEATWLDMSAYRGVYAHVFGENYYGEELDFTKFDIVVIPCDRNEMVYMATKAFQQGAVVCHFHAGNNPTNHPDDFNRRAISLYSHIMLCNMEEHKENLIDQGETPSRIFVVGSTAFDNIIYDDSITPKDPFDLVVLHPDPLSAVRTDADFGEALHKWTENSGRITVWIGPNHDKNYEIISSNLQSMKDDQTVLFTRQNYIILDSVPRPQFLSLLKHCNRAIGNSSSFYYELPILNPNATLIQIGERNKGLIVPETRIGGSKRIAKLLATIELTEQLRNKRFRQ